MLDKLRNKPDWTHPGDARLKAVLQQWRGLEPSPAFEASVWRRIRATVVEAQPVPGLGAIMRAWLAAEPAWVYAVAATAGLMVGISTALSVSPPRADSYSATALLHSQTLAGAYLTMVSGGTR